jgi:hypothetical protein
VSHPNYLFYCSWLSSTPKDCLFQHMAVKPGLTRAFDRSALSSTPIQRVLPHTAAFAGNCRIAQPSYIVWRVLPPLTIEHTFLWSFAAVGSITAPTATAKVLDVPLMTKDAESSASRSADVYW